MKIKRRVFIDGEMFDGSKTLKDKYGMKLMIPFWPGSEPSSYFSKEI